MGSLTRSQSGLLDLQKLAGLSQLATATAAATRAAAMVALADSAKVEMETMIAARIEKCGTAPCEGLRFANDLAGEYAKKMIVEG
jgi:hypothetical protein